MEAFLLRSSWWHSCWLLRHRQSNIMRAIHHNPATAEEVVRRSRHVSRRTLLKTVFGLVVLNPCALTPASAFLASPAANLPPNVLAAGVVDLVKGMDTERFSGNAAAALYLTARVGVRGPVLASIRVPQPSFPLDFQIGEGDIYASSPEEQHVLAELIRTRDLVISARLDSDGQASTRDPEDLVGQGAVYKFGTPESAQWSRAVVELKGRGVFGEFVTRKQ